MTSVNGTQVPGGGNTDPPSKDFKTRNFCFTYFGNMELQDNYEIDGMKYLIIGSETCPTTKREHLQCYIVFKGPITLKCCIKKLSKYFKGCHVEICRGTAEDNIKYCSKGGIFKEIGDRPKGQGHRSDIDLIAQKIMNHEIKAEDVLISDPEFYFKYGRVIEKIEDVALRKKNRSWMTTCEWIYGKSGTGKSEYAFKDFDESTHFVLEDDGGWWDAYKGQETVIINDFRGHISYDQLLTLIDKYPKKVRRRGREPTSFLAKHIIITSSLHPVDVYKNRNENDSIEQLLRRINIKKFKKDPFYGIVNKD